MKPSHTVSWLALLIVVLALGAAGTGLFWQDAGRPFSFATLRGEIVQIYGEGVYRLDTPITAVGFKAADTITLVLAIPLLVIATVLYRRGSLRGGLLLSGVLAYFVYNYGSMAFGAAYNNLFLVYVILLSAALFAFLLTLLSFDVEALPAHFSPRLPRRAIGAYLIISGLILYAVWLGLSVIPALLAGTAPAEVKSYTTAITLVIDLAIIAPGLVVAGALLIQRRPAGYLLASMLLVFTVVLGANLVAAGIAQLLTGVISVGQAIGFTAPFAILTLFAVWFTREVWCNLSEGARERSE